MILKTSEGELMKTPSLNQIVFPGVAGAPLFNVSEHGDVCFRSQSREDKESTLVIVKEYGETVRTPLNGIQFPVEPMIYAPIIANEHVYITFHSSPFEPNEITRYTKVDLYGRVVWEWTVAGCPIESVVTTEGGQFVLCGKRLTNAPFCQRSFSFYLFFRK